MVNNVQITETEQFWQPEFYAVTAVSSFCRVTQIIGSDQAQTSLSHNSSPVCNDDVVRDRATSQ
jgi:hypothetical protein